MSEELVKRMRDNRPTEMQRMWKNFLATAALAERQAKAISELIALIDKVAPEYSESTVVSDARTLNTGER